MADYGNIQSNTVPIGAITATGTIAIRNLFRAPDDAVLVDLNLLNGTAKPVSTSTDYGIYRVWNRGAAGATGTLLDTTTTATTGGYAMAADTAFGLLRAVTNANRELSAGDLIQIEILGNDSDDGGDLDAESAVIVDWAMGSGRGR